mgnify:CR=1 FL=1
MLALAFSFGLVSSLHCLAMCGPLQAVVMGQWLRGGAAWQWGLYHGGRLLSYALLGSLAHSLGTGLGVARWQNDFSLVAGITLLVGYFVLRLLRWDRQLYGLFLPFFQKLRRRLEGQNRILRFAGWGALNGLLPCGMVYAAAITAIGSPSLQWGALTMLAFGAGTLPLLFSFNWLGQNLLLRLGLNWSRLAPLAIVILSSLLIVRGMALDIPFLSPDAPLSSAGTQACSQP